MILCSPGISGWVSILSGGFHGCPTFPWAVPCGLQSLKQDTFVVVSLFSCFCCFFCFFVLLFFFLLFVIWLFSVATSRAVQKWAASAAALTTRQLSHPKREAKIQGRKVEAGNSKVGVHSWNKNISKISFYLNRQKWETQNSILIT